jgi:hypothetical protein
MECAFTAGIPAAWKRQKLVDIVLMCEKAEPKTAIEAIKEMNRMDGDFVSDKGSGNAGVTINIVGLDAGRVVIGNAERVVNDAGG